MSLDIVVLPAFATHEFPTDELSPWLDREWPSTRPLSRAVEDYGSQARRSNATAAERYSVSASSSSSRKP